MSAATVLAGALLTTAVLAETPSVTGAVQSVSDAEMRLDLPRYLRAGPIRGELTATPANGRYAAGASAFAQLKLSGDTDAKRGIAAELLLEAENGEIVSVTGPEVDAEETGATHLARIEGLRQGRDRTVLIEFKLRAAGNAPNTLKLTLREAQTDERETSRQGSGAAEETVAIAWPVNDCAGGYHAAIKQIGENGGNRLRESWREALRPDKSMARGWLFRPLMPRRSVRRQAETETGALSQSEQRAIYVEANGLIGTGYDSSLRESGRYGWTVAKVGADLRKYFSQAENPALCTGAIGFTDYYEKQLAPLGKRGERLAKLAADAKRLAQEKAGQAVVTARTLPGGHPAWGGATLAALKPVSDTPDDLKTRIVELMQLADFPMEAVAKVKEAEGAYAALRILDDAGLDAGEAPKMLRAELREALSAIEAAIRLEAFQQRGAALWQKLHGSLDAIREAHAKNCICGS